MPQARAAEDTGLDDHARLARGADDRAAQQGGDPAVGQAHLVEGPVR
ncbi:hypothetical protein U5640_43160 [Streptomyces sp. SS7]